MSLRANGEYVCDRDGTRLENGGVHECAVLAAVDSDNAVRTYHFCYENGCARKVLSTRNLADLKENEK